MPYGPKPIPVEVRFKRKYVIVPSGCWIWTAGRAGSGNYEHQYGKFWFNRDLGDIGAHKASYLLYVGCVPEGICVLHKCDTPPCVNPAHLRLGTQLDNIQDMNEKGRQYSRPFPGAENPNAQLDVKRVLEIRTRRNEDRRVLAAEFGVTPQTIRHILTRHTWTHI